MFRYGKNMFDLLLKYVAKENKSKKKIFDVMKALVRSMFLFDI